MNHLLKTKPNMTYFIQIEEILNPSCTEAITREEKMEDLHQMEEGTNIESIGVQENSLEKEDLLGKDSGMNLIETEREVVTELVSRKTSVDILKK